MQITIEYDEMLKVPPKEEMTIYAIEKLLNGLTIAEVNQVLGRIAERIKQTPYQTPMPRYEVDNWDNYVMGTVQKNLDGLTEKVAGKLAKSIGSTLAK